MKPKEQSPEPRSNISVARQKIAESIYARLETQPDVGGAPIHKSIVGDIVHATVDELRNRGLIDEDVANQPSIDTNLEDQGE